VARGFARQAGATEGSVSHCSSHPRRYDRLSCQIADLRQDMVRKIGCVHERCRNEAAMLARNAQLGYTRVEQLVRIPR
jgi:hypothetical protein